jgi:hypothetical protein
MTPEMIELLKKYAKAVSFYDNDIEDQIVDDYAGGNVDDAFYYGEATGTTMLAREILDSLGIEY